MKQDPKLPDPLEVLTDTPYVVPFVNPLGTVTVADVELLYVHVAATPPTVAVMPEAKLVPVTVKDVPA